MEERAERLDFEEALARSWSESESSATQMRSIESVQMTRSAFRFRLSSNGGESSLQSMDLSPLRARFAPSASLQRSHEKGGASDSFARADDDGEEEYEEDEDDDDVRRSWTTEKEPLPSVGTTGGFRFRGGHSHEEDHSDDDEDDYDDHGEDHGSDDSFGSLGWVTRQLRHLERRQNEANEDESDHDHDEAQEGDGHDDDADVEKSVREALSLLNGHDADSRGGDAEEQEQQQEQEETSGVVVPWGQPAVAHGQSDYFDIVEEAMMSDWRRAGDGHDVEEEDQEQAEHQEEEDEEEAATDGEGEGDGAEEHRDGEGHEGDEADEWLEAFTAKGRVYYYNRRTRESSWIKPAVVSKKEEDLSTEDQQGQVEAHDHEEEEEEEGEREDEEDEEEVEHRNDGDDHDDDAQSTSSMASSDHHRSPRSSHHEQEHATSGSPPNANALGITTTTTATATSNTLFCCFCGTSMAGGGGGFHDHLQKCALLRSHKKTSSPLYTQFQQMLVLLSEDTSLRSMHYASSSLEATPHQRGEPLTQQSVRESLALLRVKHRSSVKPLVRRTSVDDRMPTYQPTYHQPPARSSISVKPGLSREPPPASSRLASSSNGKAKPPSSFSAGVLLNMETCRHCSRSFAEGRLAKHEAVCPRVFGNETAWGRGASPSVHKPSDLAHTHEAHGHGHGYDHQQQHYHQEMIRMLQKKRNAKLKHTLALSFQEHQASLVECPCCKRKFAPSGAQQHIDICKTVQHRPRNHIPLMKDFATAS